MRNWQHFIFCTISYQFTMYACCSHIVMKLFNIFALIGIVAIIIHVIHARTVNNFQRKSSNELNAANGNTSDSPEVLSFAFDLVENLEDESPKENRRAMIDDEDQMVSESYQYVSLASPLFDKRVIKDFPTIKPIPPSVTVTPVPYQSSGLKRIDIQEQEVTSSPEGFKWTLVEENPVSTIKTTSAFKPYVFDPFNMDKSNGEKSSSGSWIEQETRQLFAPVVIDNVAVSAMPDLISTPTMTFFETDHKATESPDIIEVFPPSTTTNMPKEMPLFKKVIQRPRKAKLRKPNKEKIPSTPIFEILTPSTKATTTNVPESVTESSVEMSTMPSPLGSRFSMASIKNRINRRPKMHMNSAKENTIFMNDEKEEPVLETTTDSNSDVFTFFEMGTPTIKPKPLKIETRRPIFNIGGHALDPDNFSYFEMGRGTEVVKILDENRARKKIPITDSNDNISVETNDNEGRWVGHYEILTTPKPFHSQKLLKLRENHAPRNERVPKRGSDFNRQRTIPPSHFEVDFNSQKKNKWTTIPSNVVLVSPLHQSQQESSSVEDNSNHLPKSTPKVQEDNRRKKSTKSKTQSYHFEKPYNYRYGVQSDVKDAAYKHEEISNGNGNTKGQYSLNIPGFTSKVVYSVIPGLGFTSNTSYSIIGKK